MLQVKNISFSYNKKTVLKNISVNVNMGEHVSIIGESGSGKTTLLRLIYGEFDLNNGQIFWKDMKVLGPKYNLITGPNFIKYVAQEFDLMPFKTVEENIGEFLSNFYPEEKQKRIDELLEVVELTSFAKTKVNFLSGGQRQRVALARAIAKQPEVILLDEPFSHIDNFKKQSLRRSLFSYLKSKNISCIVATHDKNDVLGYSDKIVVLNNGKIIANNTPEKLYNNPENPLIASFFGEFNIINNNVIYANQLKLVERSNLKATVNKNYFKGNYYLIEASHKNKTLFFECTEELSKGSTVYLKINK